jgi:Flp pilus assembly protein TadB
MQKWMRTGKARRREDEMRKKEEKRALEKQENLRIKHEKTRRGWRSKFKKGKQREREREREREKLLSLGWSLCFGFVLELFFVQIGAEQVQLALVVLIIFLLLTH